MFRATPSGFSASRFGTRAILLFKAMLLLVELSYQRCAYMCMFIPCSRKRMNSSRQKSQEMWSCTTLWVDDGDTCSLLSCKEDIDAWESNCADRLHEFPLCQQSQDTSFNNFHQNHHIPAVQETTLAYSLTCKDSCAVLNKQHLCSSRYVWKKGIWSCTLGNENKHM